MQQPQTFTRVRGERTNVAQGPHRFNTYIDCSYANANFDRVSFQHCRFDRVHFRAARFNQAELLNCRFIDCNFDTTVFANCDLRYAEFVNCNLKYVQVRDTLPREENLRRSLLRNLRVNADTRGRSDDARWIFLDEMRASRGHYWRALSDSKYRFYCPDLKCRLNAVKQLAVLAIADILWGHGERWARVLFNATVVAIAFGIAYYLMGSGITFGDGVSQHVSVIDAIGFSFASLTTLSYGTAVANDQATRLLSTAEGVIGLIIFGLLVAAIFRQVSKR